jgi:hypothetical protein
MAKIKVDGFSEFEFEAGSIGKKVDERLAADEKHRRSLKEGGAVADAAKEREAAFMKALGIEVKKVENKAKEGSLELNDLVEIEKRVAAMKNDIALRESAGREQPDLMKAVRLYESWQDSKISVEELLEGLRALGLA